MAKLIEETKNKNEFINLVTNEKSSNEPSRNDQEAAKDVLEPGNNIQNQEEENIIAQQGQEVDKSKENSQEQEEEEEEENANDEERANFSTPPAKRSAPKPKTG